MSEVVFQRILRVSRWGDSYSRSRVKFGPVSHDDYLSELKKYPFCDDKFLHQIFVAKTVEDRHLISSTVESIFLEPTISPLTKIYFLDCLDELLAEKLISELIQGKGPQTSTSFDVLRLKELKF
jgi:hypothetical protein